MPQRYCKPSEMARKIFFFLHFLGAAYLARGPQARRENYYNFATWHNFFIGNLKKKTIFAFGNNF